MSSDRVVSAFESLPALIENDLPAILDLRSERITKADGSYVTKGDLLAQELVMSFVDQSFPGARVVSEELQEAAGDPGAEFVFVVDPIDETKNSSATLIDLP